MGAWGYGLFQSDYDYDLISELDNEAGLHQLQAAAQAKMDAESNAAADLKSPEHETFGPASVSDEEDDEGQIYYTLLHGGSDPTAVREHLDNTGILKQLIDKYAVECADPAASKTQHYAPSYTFLILCACAMTLGCSLPAQVKATLKKIYKKVGLMPEGVQQMHKALYDSSGFKDGEPYDFNSLSLDDTADAAMAKPDQVPSPFGFHSLNVMGGPGTMFWKGGDSDASKVVKEAMGIVLKEYPVGVCANCGSDKGKNGDLLLICGKCKERKYCDKACQKNHWYAHKHACVALIKTDQTA